jgi:hypothetical protein
MSNRVLNRTGARVLMREEMEQVRGGSTGCHGTHSILPKGIPDEDFECDPA